MKPLQWKAYEYEEKERPADWFWAVGIVSISLAVGAVLINNILLAILIIVSTVALTFNAIKKPRFLDYEIGSDRIKQGPYEYRYSELASYWIQEQENKLLIRSKKVMIPLIVIPLEDMHHDTVREMLDYVLHEEELHEPLSQKIMEYLGF